MKLNEEEKRLKQIRLDSLMNYQLLEIADEIASKVETNIISKDFALDMLHKIIEIQVRQIQGEVY